MANALEFDIKRTGYTQADLVKLLENIRDVTNELQTDHPTFKTAIGTLRTAQQTVVNTPPNFEIDTDFDIQNGDAFEIVVDGVSKTVATDQSFDTGTATVIATNAFWACGLLSIDVDGSTTACQFGAEAVSEAAAKLLLSAVTASKAIVLGYVAVRANTGQDWVAGTDGLTGSAQGQPAQTTTYYNDVKVGALYDAAAAAIAAPATLTNSTALTLLRG